MKRIALIVILLATLITSCGPSEADIQEAIAQTQAAAPTETPIPEPTETPKVDIFDVLVTENDLPQGYSLSQATNRYPQKYNWLKHFDGEIYTQYLENSGVEGGWVMLILIEDEAKRESYYENIVDKFWDNQFMDAGLSDRSALRYSLGTVELAFILCDSIVNVYYKRDSEREDGFIYLDNAIDRLSPVVCSSQ